MTTILKIFYIGRILALDVPELKLKAEGHLDKKKTVTDLPYLLYYCVIRFDKTMEKISLTMNEDFNVIMVLSDDGNDFSGLPTIKHTLKG